MPITLLALFAGILSVCGANVANADNLALVPFLANWTPQPGGYTVILINYDPSYQWTFTPSTGQYYFDGAHQITVTGALGGFPSTLTVSAAKSGYPTGTAKITGNVIGLPWSYTPVIQGVLQNNTGFVAQIANYDSSKIWQWSSSAGSVVINNTGLITVTGLSRGQQSVVTVNVSQIGYMVNTATYSGSALAPPLTLVPAIGSITANGATATTPVTNFDNYFDWTVTATNGTVSIDKSSGIITVNGLQTQQTSRVTVTDSHNGQVIGQTTFLAYISPSALVLKAQFGAPVPNLNGLQVQVSNYDPNFNWSVNTSAGSAQIDSSGLITVTGMQPGQTANLSVSAWFPDAKTTTTNISIPDWPAQGLSLSTSQPVPTTDGYTFKITDFNNFYNYQATVDNGSVNLDERGFAVVSGLTPGQQAQVTLTVSKGDQKISSNQIQSGAILNVQVNLPAPSSSASTSSSGSSNKKPVASASGHSSVVVHTQASAPVITLICLKGTQHKFVTGVKPTCPAGYVRQK